MTINESNTFWRLKGIAVFTIFFAHIPYQGANVVMLYLYNYLGIVGVPVFLLLSGLFEYESKTPWISKLKNLFYPLLIWGTLAYLPELIISKMISGREIIVGYLKWLYGCGTWLYFVPVLLWCKVFCKSDKTWALLLLTFLSIVSIILTQFSVIPYNDFFTKYTNPFNFLIYYICGILIRKYRVNYRRPSYLAISIFLLCGVISVWNVLPSYFNMWCIPFSLAAFVLLYNLARVTRFGVEIGKMSYVIYLTHMIPLGILIQHLQVFSGTPLQIVRVPIAFAIITFAVWALKQILNIFRIQNIGRLIGYR